MIKKILGNTKAQKSVENRAQLYRNLIRHEAKIGGQLFGPTRTSQQRELICFDERTWIWHEQLTDPSGINRIMTTRYDVRPDGIFKAQDGQPYMALTKLETIRLQQAAQSYQQRVFNEIYAKVA